MHCALNALNEHWRRFSYEWGSADSTSEKHVYGKGL